MIIRCRHRIPSPEAVGFLTAEGLKAAAARYPHLRPCKKHGWNSEVMIYLYLNRIIMRLNPLSTDRL